MTGSFCTFDEVFVEIEKLVETGANIYPFLSRASNSIDSRFGKSKDFYNKITRITGKEPITTIEGAEPVGPQGYLDAYVIIPFGQDNPTNKVNSLVAHTNLLIETIEDALEGKQIQPIIQTYM